MSPNAQTLGLTFTESCNNLLKQTLEENLTPGFQGLKNGNRNPLTHSVHQSKQELIEVKFKKKNLKGFKHY